MSKGRCQEPDGTIDAQYTHLSLVGRLYRFQRPDALLVIAVIAIVRGLARIVAVHSELFGGAGDTVIVKDGVNQGWAVGVAVEQRLDRRGRGVEQRRHGRRFVVNDLRTHRRTEPNLMYLRRLRRLDGRRADALIAE